MIDIHAHISPDIDDGSASFEESFAIIEAAFQSGTTAMVATPHFLNPFQKSCKLKKSDIIKSFNELKSYCESRGSLMKLFCGAEHFGINEIALFAEQDELITINNSRYLLVEFDFDDDFRRVNFVLSELISAGFVPIVAHPERYYFLLSNFSNAYNLVSKGCLFQLNKGGPFGRHGAESKELSFFLLENRLVHFVASDCHSPFCRTAKMDKAHELLTYGFGEEYVSKIFFENPRKVIYDEVIDVF